MKISISVVDLSGLPQWPSRILASGRVAASVDRWYHLRLSQGAGVGFLAPAKIGVVPIGSGCLLLFRLEA